MTQHAQRRDKLRRQLRKNEVDALLINNVSNVTYLTGFTGDSSLLLIAPERDLLITDSRYETQLAEECPGLELSVRTSATKQIDQLAKVIRKLKPPQLGIEGSSMAVSTAVELSEKLKQTELVATEGLVEDLRSIKDKWEIDEIRQAIWYAERGFEILRASLRPEQTEREIANTLEFNLRKLGAKGCAFPPIVGVGARAALPHGQPCDARVGASDHLLVDWGAWGRLYRSDLTRVLITAKVSAKLEKIYNVVLKAQLAAIVMIKPGVEAKAVHAAAAKVIAAAGYEKHFGHGIGHGFGIDIHESPRMSPIAEGTLKAGMVVTVEPGIYLADWGGVRIEDDILVTRDGHEVLTHVPKRFEEMVTPLAP